MKRKQIMLIVLMALSMSSLHLLADYSLESPFTFSFYHRFRVETWDNTINLNEQVADGFNYTRHKSSFGLLWKVNENVEVFGKLTNEFRVYLAPKDKKGNNEIFFDNLYVKWNQSDGLPFTLTVGRQDIQLGEGFVVMDGQAASGSRSFYFNAVRLDLTPWENHKFTLYYGYVPNTDNLLPVIKLTDVADQILEEQAHNSFGVYYTGVFSFAQVEAYFIRKDTLKNTLFTSESHFNTIGARCIARFNDQLTLTGEAALQTGSIKDTALAGEPTRDKSGFGGHTHLDYTFAEDIPFFKTLILGGIFLSGDDPQTRDKVEGWDPVFSRWPKWNDSYIYCFQRESRTAYWSNLSALYLTLNGKITDNLSAQVSYFLLGAQYALPSSPFPGGTDTGRGGLAIAKLSMTFTKQLSGHFLWEHFTPGTFYFPGATDYNWIQFQMLLKL